MNGILAPLGAVSYTNLKEIKAIEHKHMMMQEAAAIAAKADVGEMWLTPVSYTHLPGEVTGLKITSAYTSSLTLKWNKQENVDGYIVYVWEPSNATWTRLATVSYTHLDVYKRQLRFFPDGELFLL